MINISPVELWLLVGCICLIAEFTNLPGIGLLFLGLGSLTTSIFIYNYPRYIDYQLATVGLISLLWLIILWWPLKKYLHNKKDNLEYLDMINNEVEVYGNKITIGKIGQVKWSGAIMNAKLEDTENLVAEVGEKLYIKEIHGNVLICAKK